MAKLVVCTREDCYAHVDKEEYCNQCLALSKVIRENCPFFKLKKQVNMYDVKRAMFFSRSIE